MHTYKYRLQAIIVLSILIFALQACGKSGVFPDLDQPIKINVSLRENLSFAPLLIANEEGFFSEFGLEIDFVAAARPAVAYAAMLQGDLDVHPGLFTIGMFNAAAQGEAIRIVANKGYFEPNGCTYLGFSAAAELVDSGELSSYSDLQGRSFATSVDEFAGFILDTALGEGGLSLNDVLIKNIPHPARAPALADGAVDLVYGGEPDLTRIELAGTGATFIRGEQVLPNAVWGTLLFGPSLLEENRDAGNRFMAGYLKGVRQYNQGKTERNLEILVKTTGLDRDLLEQACWPPITDDGGIDVQSVIDFQSWANKRGLLDTPATEEQFWDSSFIEFAMKTLP